MEELNVWALSLREPTMTKEGMKELCLQLRKFECSFFLSPPLSASEDDQQRWDAFLDNIKKLLDEDEVLEVDEEERCLKFCIGDEPFLPFDGHAFKCFSSRSIPDIVRDTEYYIRMMFQIAQGHFGDRARFHHELLDNTSTRLRELAAKFMDGAVTAEISRLGSRSKVDVKPLSTYYAIQSVSRKGMGLIATQSIPKGTRILWEKPLFVTTENWTTPDQVSHMVAAELRRLPKEEQRLFFGLTNSFPQKSKPLWGIAKTNGIPIETESTVASNTEAPLHTVQKTTSGVFVQASRINHSCEPSCFLRWNPRLEAMTVHALRDMEPGEEITWNYLRDTFPAEQRFYQLVTKFAFLCECERCTAPEYDRIYSDGRLKRAIRLVTQTSDIEHLKGHPIEHLRQIRELADIYVEEKITDTRLAVAYGVAYLTALVRGDQARAKIFACREHEAFRYCVGEDNEDTIAAQEHIEKATLRRSHGRNRKKGPLGEDMTGTNDGFENWLWGRGGYGKAARKGKRALTNAGNE